MSSSPTVPASNRATSTAICRRNYATNSPKFLRKCAVAFGVTEQDRVVQSTHDLAATRLDSCTLCLERHARRRSTAGTNCGAATST